MARIGNETRLILKLARERTDAKLSHWKQVSSNPNSNSHNTNWMAGYCYANNEWVEVLFSIIRDLERK